MKVAGEYAAKINVCLGSMEVCGTSIMGLMMLAASRGAVISVSADGDDAETAVEALSELVRNRFDEDCLGNNVVVEKKRIYLKLVSDPTFPLFLSRKILYTS